jgi:zinc and cadmium transporter
MANVWLYSLISVLAVSMISLVGVFSLPIKTEKLRSVLIYMISFSAGALFAAAFFELLPEVVAKFGFRTEISLYVLIGIAFSFFVEKVIHWRHCHLPITKTHVHPFALMNLFGDSVHNFIDGLIIGASYLVSTTLGFTTTIAVILHEIPQEIGDFGVLLHGGFSKAKALLLNFVTALTAVVGTVIALLVGTHVENLTLFLIPFAAGGFIYIAGSDLIPELHKETIVRRSVFQLIFFIVGVVLILGIRLLE